MKNASKPGATLIVAIGDKMSKPVENESATFKAPEGFTLPDGTKPGDPFPASVTLKQNDDGTLQVLEVEGMPVAAEPETPEEDAAETEEAPEPAPVPEEAKPTTFTGAVMAKLRARTKK